MAAVSGAGSLPASGSGGISRAHAWTWFALLLAAAIAWLLTVAQARRMGIGPGTMGLALPAFLAMWIPMMAAMMFPALAPVAILWGRSISRTTTGARRASRQTAFVGGYVLAWAAIGVLAFGVLLGAERLVSHAPGAARWIGAGVFLVAGLYQLTPLKRVCLRHCRSPLGQFLRYGTLRGRAIDLRVGVYHGAYCVGCCWALMLVLVAVGVMNLLAMVVLAAVVFVEKIWRYGQVFSWAVSAGFVALAVLALFYPAMVPGLTPMAPASDMPGGGM